MPGDTGRGRGSAGVVPERDRVIVGDVMTATKLVRSGIPEQASRTVGTATEEGAGDASRGQLAGKIGRRKLDEGEAPPDVDVLERGKGLVGVP